MSNFWRKEPAIFFVFQDYLIPYLHNHREKSNVFFKFLKFYGEKTAWLLN